MNHDDVPEVMRLVPEEEDEDAKERGQEDEDTAEQDEENEVVYSGITEEKIPAVKPTIKEMRPAETE